eukprot:CAMPEP_0206503540 /NCGR_PEP_ID=MMETSP0324_2-20121206/54794_1 /ASSEMBLY_ACC=CAM_ASM_000836 /TAXON_ID=2866 /ORGANISM="Crypthecodinium cohnii, Strain Seligo" /LENGTH=536 /DNA_ID=CAMNT_0053992225 /DNA_START=260 /DNA_END=1871 /DNA_ORIENTATION=-
MLVGHAFSYYFQEDVYHNRDDLQRFAFLLVLLNGGFEVSVRRMRPQALLISLLPAVLEILGIALMATWTTGMAFKEGTVLASVLFPIGEGLVIPKMNEFKTKFPNHPLPRVTLTWAPLEATFALSFFSFLSSLSSVLTEGKLSILEIFLDVILRLVTTIIAGGVIGAATGWLLSRSATLKFGKKPFFTGSAVEAFLIVLALAFGGFGLAEVIPNGIAEGSHLFDPDLCVIAIGSSFAEFATPNLLHAVEGYLSGIWVFGAIILFSMLGSRTEVSVFNDVTRFFPFMVTGVCCRLIGFCIVVPVARRLSNQQVHWRRMLPEILFFWLCCLPRATLQGALGSKPIQSNFFSHSEQGVKWQEFISDGARLYILFFSVIGSVLLEIFGKKLLKATADDYHVAAPHKATPSEPHSGAVAGAVFSEAASKSKEFSIAGTPVIGPSEDGHLAAISEPDDNILDVDGVFTAGITIQDSEDLEAFSNMQEGAVSEVGSMDWSCMAEEHGHEQVFVYGTRHFDGAGINMRNASPHSPSLNPRLQPL